MPIYWGDLHCHCAASYGHGTPTRALANARSHLDFCSITGHAFWPDMPTDLARYDVAITTHMGGFAKLQLYWKELLAELRQANVAGQFVTLPSYEWHSSRWGDYNCYFCGDNAPLIDAPTLPLLLDKLRRQKMKTMALPHHVAYPAGFRGIDWETFDERMSPLVEIFSNHGCGEADDAPYEYHHAMGPRVGTNTVREGLLRGHRFGFYAGTDSHDGYPGHYGHGRVGVMAERLDRKSIWEALIQRRTIATTGARIVAQMNLGEAKIGQVVSQLHEMPLSIRIEGTAPLDKVELIEGGTGRWSVRSLPVGPMDSDFRPGFYKVKVEMGWGFEDQRSEWDVVIRVIRGKLLEIEPCFRYNGYNIAEEESSEQIVQWSERSANWQCRASGNASGMFGGTHFHAGGTQAVVLGIEAGQGTRLQLKVAGLKIDALARDLTQNSMAQFIGELASPAVKIHRAVPQRQFTFHCEEPYTPPNQEPGFIYLRIRQIDGHTAWVSPIWYH